MAKRGEGADLLTHKGDVGGVGRRVVEKPVEDDCGSGLGINIEEDLPICHTVMPLLINEVIV